MVQECPSFVPLFLTLFVPLVKYWAA